jgi:putative chitinase
MMILTSMDLIAGMRRTPLTPDRAGLWIGAVNDALREYDISTPERAAMFLAQVAHECLEFTELRENMNYSADALVREWPTRFWLPDPHDSRSVDAQAADHPGKANAMEYHRQPQKIANRVYANRMGNGDEMSGDGWAYRGGGAIQMSGKEAYRNMSIALCGDADTLLVNPDLVESPDYAMQSAGRWWADNDMNRFADACDIDGCTTRVNGGTTGATYRRAYYTAFMQRLGIYN